MLVYLGLLAMVMLAVAASRVTHSRILSRILLGIAFASLVAVAGLRDRSVGTDTGSYVWYFNDIRTFTDVAAVSSEMGEHGFWVLTWLVHFIADQYVFYFFAIAVIVIGCYQRTILVHSSHILVSFYVFITAGIYTFFLNGARQGIACAIFAMAIGPLVERNFKKYLWYVLLAVLFHKSAMVMIPVYFIMTPKSTLNANLLIVAMGCAIVAFYETFLGFASGIDARYASSGAVGEGGGGEFIIAFNIVLGVCLMIFRNLVSVGRERYDQYLRLYMVGAMIDVVSLVLRADPSGLLRLSMYFSVSLLFLWPIVLSSLTERLSKFTVAYVFVVGYLIYFVLTTQRFSDLVPYALNASLFAR